MFSFFHRKKKKANADARERALNVKLENSQMLLLDAAVRTADAAQHVTTKLKSAMEDTARQLQTTIRLMTDAMIICDDSGAVRAFNPAAEKIFNRSTVELENCNIVDLLRINGQVCHNPQSIWNCQTSWLNGVRDGEDFDCETTMTELDRHDGSIVKLLLIRDLTEIRASQKETKEQADRSNAIFDLSYEGILVIQGDRIVAANPSAERLFGKAASELLTTRLEALVSAPAPFNSMSEDEAPGEDADGQAKAARLVLTGAGITWNDSPASLLLIRDQNSINNIKTNNIKNNTIEMIVCFDINYVITFANPAFCAYYAQNKSEIVGKDIRDVLPDEAKNAMMLKLSSLTPEIPSRRIQIYLRNQSGETILQEWLDHAEFDENGNVVEYQRSGKDISDLIGQICPDEKSLFD